MRERMLKTAKALLGLIWANKRRFIMTFILLVTAFCTFNYIFNSKIASVNISLNYSEASQGLNPNKTRFNSYEMINEEVLTKAIEYAGLTNELTYKDLSECISIHPIDSGNASGDQNYISTTYRMDINTEKYDLKYVSTLDLLEMVCRSYKDYFMNKYGDSMIILSEDHHIDTDEPYLSLQQLSLRANQINRYLSSRINENKNFTDENTGESFLTLQGEVQNILNNDIPTIRSYILESSVSSDKNRFIAQLEYKNRLEQIKYDKSYAYFVADKKTIAMYDPTMIAIVMIPTTTIEDRYYMSRTDTAMDTLANDADTNLSEATYSKDSITETNRDINKFSSRTATTGELIKGNRMISNLSTVLTKITERLRILDTAYIRYKAQNYLVYNYNISSTLNKMSVKSSVIQAIMVLIAMCTIGFIRFLKRERCTRKVYASAKEGGHNV